MTTNAKPQIILELTPPPLIEVHVKTVGPAGPPGRTETIIGPDDPGDPRLHTPWVVDAPLWVDTDEEYAFPGMISVAELKRLVMKSNDFHEFRAHVKQL
jgi:hypothetical protein